MVITTLDKKLAAKKIKFYLCVHFYNIISCYCFCQSYSNTIDLPVSIFSSK